MVAYTQSIKWNIENRMEYRNRMECRKEWEYRNRMKYRNRMEYRTEQNGAVAIHSQMQTGMMNSHTKATRERWSQ